MQNILGISRVPEPNKKEIKIYCELRVLEKHYDYTDDDSKESNEDVCPKEMMTD